MFRLERCARAGLYSGRGSLSLSLAPPEKRRRRRLSIFSCLMPARALFAFLTTRGSICPRLMSPPGPHAPDRAALCCAREHARAMVVYCLRWKNGIKLLACLGRSSELFPPNSRFSSPSSHIQKKKKKQ